MERRKRPGAKEKDQQTRQRRKSLGLDQKTTLMRKYGLAIPTFYQILVVEQRFRCAICGIEGALHVDHDHKTNKVRGLLCGCCNRAIGLLRDDPTLLERAITYLRDHGANASPRFIVDMPGPEIDDATWLRVVSETE